MTEGKSMLDTILQIDPDIWATLEQHANSLDVGDFANIEDVLKGGFCVYDRDWRKALFRLFDAKLISLGLEHLQSEERLNDKLFPFSSYYGQRMVQALLARPKFNRGTDTLSCLERLKKLKAGPTARVFTFWDFTETFSAEMTVSLKRANVAHLEEWQRFTDCLTTVDRIDATKVIVSYFNNTELSQSIYNLQKGELADVMSLMQSLIDDNNEYSEHLKMMLYDLVKRKLVIPGCLVISDIHQIGVASVAHGGMSDIFKGYAISMGKVVALKVPRGVRLNDKTRSKIQEVYEEAIVWRQLKHENVMPFLGIAYNIPAPGSVALISQWYDNGSLDFFLGGHKAVNRLEIIIQIARGMCFLHAQRPSFIHGDLRAANILVDNNQRPLIADFGLSKFRTIQTEVRTAETSGTLRWQAPETLGGEDSYHYKGHPTTASDVYAFGMTCFEVLSGEIPFKDLNDYQVMKRIMGSEPFLKRPTNPDVLAHGLDDRLWDILSRCWSKNPKSRPSMDRIYEFLTDNTSNVMFNPGRELRVGIWSIIATVRFGKLIRSFGLKKRLKRAILGVVFMKHIQHSIKRNSSDMIPEGDEIV